MASDEVIEVDTPTQDVEMEGQEGAENADENNGDDSAAPEATETENATERITFADYLSSPIVSLVCGKGDERQTLSAHQLLLMQSPFLSEKIAQFSDKQTTRTIELPDKDLTTVSSFLEYLYRKDYFPALGQHGTLEPDPTTPEKDDEGTALLRHARVYTLAQDFGVPALATLAHKKIHNTQASAKGEIQYARFVYKYSSPEDVTIRNPVANFWAKRSHVLRHSAETEFRDLCLEFPQFGFDVLQMLLDMQEKKMHRDSAGGTGASSSQSGRKRARVSQA